MIHDSRVDPRAHTNRGANELKSHSFVERESGQEREPLAAITTEISPTGDQCTEPGELTVGAYKTNLW
jgi:hypothetical protein